MKTLTRYSGCALLLGFAICMAPAGSAAQSSPEPELISTHRDWSAYVLDVPDGKTCYLGSAALESDPQIPDRGTVWVLVTKRPSAGVENEVSVIAGYEYQPDSAVSAIVDGRKFEMFTQGDGAWLRSAEQESKMVRAMRKGKRLTIVGSTGDGTVTTDKFSLFGFSAARRAVNKACKSK